MDNLKLWNDVKQPPATALKEIQAGRLKGKSDINPQWRYQVMTEQFGPCGVGWKYTIDKLWTEPAGNEVFAFALVSVYIKDGDAWSEPIPGIGGHMLMEQERAGLHANDEGFKMAVTDALSVALKMLGVAADIYMGKWDGSKYADKKQTSIAKDKDMDGFVTEAEGLFKPISDAKARGLHSFLGSKGIKDSHAFASKVLGRTIAHFAEMNDDDAEKVKQAALKEA